MLKGWRCRSEREDSSSPGPLALGRLSWQFFALHKLARMGATAVIDFKGYDDCYCFSG